MRRYAAVVGLLVVLSACSGGGGGSSGGATGSTTTPGSTTPPPARGPALEAASLADRDGNGFASLGDELVLRFDEDADLTALTVSDLLLLSGADTLGAGASLRVLSAREAAVTLGAGASLSLYETYLPGSPTNQSPAAVSIRAGTVRGPTGLPARDVRPVPILLPRAARLKFQGDRSRGSAFALYRGQMHSHTYFSDGIGEPGQAYDTARFQGGLDFFMVTDHVEAYFVLPGRWSDSKAIADSRNVDGAFVAIAGYEWSYAVKDLLKAELYNHCNIVTEELIDAASSLTLFGMYQSVRRFPDDAIGKFNHPASRSSNVLGINVTFNNWDDYRLDPAADKHFALVRAMTGGNSDQAGFIPLLEHGWHVAPAYGEDNHNGSWGLGASRMGIYASFLTREGVKEAMRSMRTFTTNDRTAWVKLTAPDDQGDLWMGSTVMGPGPVELRIEGGDPDDELDFVELISQGGAAVATHQVGASSVDWRTVVDPPGDAWFYARIHEKDGDVIYSAPIFIDR